MLLLLSLVLPTTATAAGQTSWMASRDGQGKGTVYCQQQFDCYCQWMNALAPRICLPDDQLMSFHLQLRSKRCGSCSSFVCPEGCGNTFCGLQLQLLLFLPLLMPLFPLPHRNTAPQLDPCAATNSHPARWCCSCVSLQGVFMLFVVCYLPFRNCVLAMNWLQTTFPFWPLYGAHSTNGRA